MFDKTNSKEIGKEIYVYKNFVDKNYCNIILNEVKNVEESHWKEFALFGRYLCDININSLFLVLQKMNSLIHKDCFLNQGLRVQRMNKDSYSPPHSDNYQYLDTIKSASLYKEGEAFDLKQNSYYGTVFYFNEFEGGELFYNKQNIEYSPEPGDLVIHSAFEIAEHSIKKVLSDTRYSYASNIYKMIKVPKVV